MRAFIQKLTHALALLCLSLSFSLSLSASDREIFDEITSAIKNQIPKVKLDTVQDKYKGAHIAGRGYVISVSKDVSGDTVVNLSVEKDRSVPVSVSVAVFMRPNQEKHVNKISKEKYVYFSGTFENVKMNTIVIRNGIVR
ncbi:MAG: hypothetical protein ABH872_01265 [Candidatus Omnitrophota bacterium]